MDRKTELAIELGQTIYNNTVNSLTQQRDEAKDEIKALRHLLFIAHGSEEHYLYGDDGERHCNTCMIDFNNDSIDVVKQKIYRYNMRKISDLKTDSK